MRTRTLVLLALELTAARFVLAREPARQLLDYPTFKTVTSLFAELREPRLADGTTEAGFELWSKGQMSMPAEGRFVTAPGGTFAALAVWADQRGYVLLVTRAGERWARKALIPLEGQPWLVAEDNGLVLSKDDVAHPWDGVEALGELASDDPARRRSGAAALVTRLQALMDDDMSGRSRPLPTPFWGGHGDVPAREVRKRLAATVSLAPATEEVVPVLEWLLFSERLVESQVLAAKKLAAVEGEGASRLVLVLLVKPHPVGRVLEMALETHARRAGKAPSVAALRGLVHHHRSRVRELARRYLSSLGHPVEPYDPEKSFSPVLRSVLASVSAFALTPVSKDAPLLAIKPRGAGGKGRRSSNEVRGFVLQERGGALRLLTDHLEEIDLELVRVATRRPVPLEEEVARVVALRKSGKAHEVLSRAGGLTAQFEPGAMSLYEVFLGAIALERGDARRAGAVLFPALERLEDDRWLYEIARDQWGTIHFKSMLQAFAGDRDYERAARIAKHLLGRFEGLPQRPTIEKLARELEERREDWKAFTLPTPGEWARSREKISRRETMDFLCHHLRLLNCFQGGQPGGLGYSCTMHREPDGMVDAAWSLNRGKTEVINPYVELIKLPLTVADIPQLASHLEDERFILAVSFWRDFHPSRQLHQVNEVVASLIDGLAQRDLCRIEELVALDAKGRKARIAEIVAWAEQNKDRPEKDLLLDIVRTRPNLGSAYFEDLVDKLVKLEARDAVPVILAHLDRPGLAGYERESIFRACSRLDGRSALERARSSLNEHEPGVRIAAGIIVYRFGDRAEGRRAIARALDQGSYSTLTPASALAGVKALLESGAKEDVDAAKVVFERDYFTQAWHTDRRAIADVFGERGAVVYRFYKRMIEEGAHKPGVTTSSAGGKTVTLTAAHTFAREFLVGFGRGKSGVEWPGEDSMEAMDRVVRTTLRWLERRIAQIEGR